MRGACAFARARNRAAGQRRVDRRVRHPRAAGEIFPLGGKSDIAADRLGEHNEALLRELLALTDQEIAGLYADKVIVRDPLLDTP
jgi:crotonobetainyl-CoA:carnitine CoA-transferase CaiB-like acyl-CoA transferase